MRITGIETHVVNAEMRNWVFVRVETDQSGLFGWGEATLEWKTRGVVGAVEDLKPLLLGRDPRDIEQAIRVMKKHSFWRLGAIGMSAISGIEIALWDIAGKALGVPVWRLLGGKVRDKVRVYTHLGMGDMRAVYETNDEGPLVERALEVVAKGYRAFKAVFIPYTHYTAPLPDVDKVASLMSALRAAVGPKVEIMVDFHGRPASAAAALAYIDALRSARPMFVEEPVPPGEIASLKAVAAHARIPLATGERLIDRIEFHDLLAACAVDVIQPDICHCGGLLEAKKIAAMAEAVSVGVAPHNPLGPDRGGRRAALRRLNAEPCDPGGNGWRGALVFRGRARPDPHGGRLLASAGSSRTWRRDRRSRLRAPSICARGTAHTRTQSSTTAQS